MSAGQGRGTLPDLVVSQLYTAVVSDILTISGTATTSSTLPSARSGRVR